MKLKLLNNLLLNKLKINVLSSYKCVHNHQCDVNVNDNNQFVPSHRNVRYDDIEKLQNFITKSKSILVLTGAGISTESGIPDYRSDGVGLYARSNHRPVQYKEFITSATIRQRYWARNYLGFQQWSSFEPNINHHILRQWELNNKLSYIITQNVDRLHQKAGSERVIELHGSGYLVKCLHCKYRITRIQLQQILQQLNSDLLKHQELNVRHVIRPDGDVDINSDFVRNFQFPSCPACDGIIKPDIVFFGDNVPKDRVDDVYRRLSESDALLIIGSSLHVYSGYRFAAAADDMNIPISIINIGTTRIDDFQNLLKFDLKAGDILTRIVI